jgi:hypothetical protein
MVVILVGRRRVMKDVEAGLVVASIDVVVAVQQPVLIAVEDHVISDAQTRSGGAAQLGRHGDLERIGLNGSRAEGLRLHSAERHVGQRVVGVPS